MLRPCSPPQLRQAKALPSAKPPNNAPSRATAVPIQDHATSTAATASTLPTANSESAPATTSAAPAPRRAAPSTDPATPTSARATTTRTVASHTAPRVRAPGAAVSATVANPTVPATGTGATVSTALTAKRASAPRETCWAVIARVPAERMDRVISMDAWASMAWMDSPDCVRRESISAASVRAFVDRTMGRAVSMGVLGRMASVRRETTLVVAVGSNSGGGGLVRLGGARWLLRELHRRIRDPSDPDRHFASP